jgi:hypothetical protein
VAALSLAAFVLASRIGLTAAGQPVPGINNVFYRLYGLHEWPFFLMLALFCAAAGLSLMRPQAVKAQTQSLSVGHRWILVIALGVVLGSWAGHRLVMHSFALSLDEYNAEFQAQIFARGEASAAIPGRWEPFARAATPGYVTYMPTQRRWVSGYLPVYAAMRAIWLKPHIASLLNPILAGLSILLVATIAGMLWPGSATAPGLAAVLLACSCQFLFMSMTSYSMAAHLCFNLLWLVLYLLMGRTTRKWPLLMLPWVGAFAIGLHNPFPHLLFVAPFLLSVLRTKQFGRLTYICCIYLLGGLTWIAWARMAVPPEVQSHAFGTFGIPDGLQLLTEVMSLSLVASWQTPVLVLGFMATLLSWRWLDRNERDLLIGILLTLGFYVFYLRSQGHGWGYRYVYGTLGNLVLLGALGLSTLGELYGRERVRSVVIASVLCTLAVQAPLRATQISRFVQPFAVAMRALHDASSSAVVVPSRLIWYGMDLVRNDPDGAAPLVLDGPKVSPRTREALQRAFPGRVWYVRPEELASFGLTAGTPK